MENPLPEIKKEQTDPLTNLLEVDQQDGFLFLNKLRKGLQDKLCGIRVDSKSVCRICVKDFVSPKDLEIHRQRVHIKNVDAHFDQIIDNGNYTYYCNSCSFKSDMLSCCKDHMKSHSEQNLSVISISKDEPYVYQYQRFQCKLCKYNCFNQPAIIRHVKKPHLEIKDKQCELCGVKFDNLATFDNHKCIHTSEKSYKGTKPDGPFNDTNSTNLSDVIKQEEYLILDDPETKVKKSLSMQNKFKTECVEIAKEEYYIILNEIYRCTICPFGTNELTKIESHFKLHNISKVGEAAYKVAGTKMFSKLKDYVYECGDTLYWCKVCDFKSFEHDLIKQHVDKFHINVTSRCEVCTKFFVSSLLLKVHHGDLITSQYKCLRCEYTSSEPLTKHMEIHPNKCSECAVTPVTRSRPFIRQNYRTTDNTIYHCSLCSSKFPIMSSWLQHNTTFHPKEKQQPILILKDAQYEYKPKEQSFQCNLCDFNRSDHCKMKIHFKRTHLNIGSYQCELCGKTFYDSNTFKIHMRRHTGEKPFKCTECDYAGYGSLGAHKEVHNKNKRYHCNVCEYKSARRARLKVHMRTHTGEKPFKCLICDYAATHKVSLVHHMKNKHTNVA